MVIERGGNEEEIEKRGKKGEMERRPISSLVLLGCTSSKSPAEGEVGLKGGWSDILSCLGDSFVV